MEAGAGPSWAAADTQTRGTSHHKSRPGDFWAGKLWLLGRWTTGRVGMLRVKGRMQASTLDPRHLRGCQRWEPLGGRFLASACHIPGVPGWGRVRGIPEPGLLLWVVCLFLPLTHQAGLSIPPNVPGRWATPDEWEPGEGAARRPAGARSHRQASVFIFLPPPPPSLGGVCQEGEGKGWGPQVIFPRRGHSRASSGQRGWGTLSLSHVALLSAPPQDTPGPHIWAWEGVGGWQISHFRPPSLLSPASCSLGAPPLRI